MSKLIKDVRNYSLQLSLILFINTGYSEGFLVLSSTSGRHRKMVLDLFLKVVRNLNCRKYDEIVLKLRRRRCVQRFTAIVLKHLAWL